jgi:predicted kinase
MPESRSPMLVVVCGWPLSGKTAIAERLSEVLAIPFVDIDKNIRRPMFGQPHPRPESEELKQIDREEMSACYEILLHIAEVCLRLHRRLIISATFSRNAGIETIGSISRKYPEADIKVIWCRPKNDTEEEIERRLARRREETDQASSVTTMRRYAEVKERYEDIVGVPHLELDTSPPKTVTQSESEAIRYILA